MNTTNEQIECIIDLAYITAARKEELLNITLSDIKQDGLHIRNQKTGSSHIHKWTPAMNTVISRAKKLRNKHSSTFLFDTRDGTQYTSNAFNNIWRRYKKNVGLTYNHFHEIRVKSINDAYRKYGLAYAQALAGY